jgi:hypothetical protein
VVTGLDCVASGLSKYLAGDAAAVLRDATRQFESSYAVYARYVGRNPPELRPWGYAISRERPLSFLPTSVDGYVMRVDLACNIGWLDPAKGPIFSELAMRVWALDGHVVFRDGLDADNLSTCTERVMLRYHFEIANSKQRGPTWHVQAGGNALESEYCWLHEGFSVPRLAHPALDVVLGSELIIANFVDPTVTQIRDAAFIGAVRDSQNDFVREHFVLGLDAIDRGKSVLASLWNGR